MRVKINQIRKKYTRFGKMNTPAENAPINFVP